MRSKKFTCRITFDIDDVEFLARGDRKELRSFIKDALETWGGQRSVHDWLFGSLERVSISAIEPVKSEDGQS